MRHIFYDSLKRFFVACALTVVGIFSAHAATLPTGYTELEYVDMQSGSYLGVTDVPVYSGYKVEFVMKTTNVGTALCNYFGGRANGVPAGGGFRFTHMASNNNTGNVMYGFDTNDGYTTRSVSIKSNKMYKYTYDNGVCTLAEDGVVVDTHTYTINDTVVPGWGINAYTASSGSNWTASGEGIYFYGLKIWNAQGQLIADYVPAKYGNSVGVYDTVNDQFYTNAGTGTFTAGPDLVTDGAIKIATTKYTENAFAGLVATLNSAIDKVTNIVDDTVQQATEIGVLAETKQDRPDTDCPAGRKCLLIMGADNKPHWYLIQE